MWQVIHKIFEWLQEVMCLPTSISSSLYKDKEFARLNPFLEGQSTGNYVFSPLHLSDFDQVFN